MAKVLVIEDSASMRWCVQEAVSSLGHTVVPACDGIEGIARAKEDTFDLVITDIRMPRADGITVIQTLRALESYKNVPILVLTLAHEARIREPVKKAGATGWLSKPFKTETLVDAVKALVAKAA